MAVAVDKMGGELDVAEDGTARAAAREARLKQARAVARAVATPAIGMLAFLGVWAAVASSIETPIGAVPGPVEVWQAAGTLVEEHGRERAKEQEFYERQEQRKATFLAENPGKEFTVRKYAGKPTYLDQILTSLKTVFAGFVIATLIAVPVGIVCGMSKGFFAAVNPFIQLFRPVSPLAWLPIVMILVSALYNPTDPTFEKSFISSAITVALCSLWPSLINTALGVASVDKDHLNVARVLQLGWYKRVTKIVVPSALPLIFTGMRLSLGVGWMVLIAAEMLAQNPGLGKFVWDMFQNGSSSTLAMIMVAVFTIGTIGFALDRIMVMLERMVTYARP